MNHLPPEINQILCGDAQQRLIQLPDHCIDLIFTSPPYANQRRKHYPSVAAAQYVDWFLPISRVFYAVPNDEPGQLIVSVQVPMPAIFSAYL